MRSFTSDKRSIPPCPTNRAEKPQDVEGIDLSKVTSKQLYNLAISRNRPTKVMYFVCNVCNGANLKSFSTHSYEKGVVIVRCDNCKRLHLVADNIGWYDSQNPPGKIEDFLKNKVMTRRFSTEEEIPPGKNS